jgi:hypothetical protein
MRAQAMVQTRMVSGLARFCLVAVAFQLACSDEADDACTGSSCVAGGASGDSAHTEGGAASFGGRPTASGGGPLMASGGRILSEGGFWS